MKVKLTSGHTVYIKWEHDYLKKLRIETVERDKQGNLITNEDGTIKTEVTHFCELKNPNKRFTRCMIYLGEYVSPDTMIAASEVKCHHEDDYNKCEGRIKSLTSALKSVNEGPDVEIFLSKEDRKQIWMQYFKDTKCSPFLKKMVEEQIATPLLEGMPL